MRASYNDPLVEGTRPSSRGSSRDGLAQGAGEPLEAALGDMVAVVAVERLDVQRDAAVAPRRPGTTRARARCRRRRSSPPERRCGRPGKAGRKCRARRASAPRPWAGGCRHSGRCPSCRRAPSGRPGRARCRYPRWCGGGRHAGRPSPSPRGRRGRGARAAPACGRESRPRWRWSALPVPSRARDTDTSVSAVRRLTLAARMGTLMVGTVGGCLARPGPQRHPPAPLAVMVGLEPTVSGRSRRWRRPARYEVLGSSLRPRMTPCAPGFPAMRH